ncbi:methyltransferase [Legionella steigerwaltii]|uniref:Methyltransferase n=1 Tax=Legionella steigerwaltii TaxID=460 RepID=A0A378L6N1_9GAMM|nr:5-histidylcysteine sulfoxide synthase [Legionella steigerwaltii]KTD77036.1 methyltransferase [Legionella steigerwaltii]STY22476.1 methyltransferase [Legionella steigerwaltii]
MNKIKTPLLDGLLTSQKLDELKEYFRRSFETYENLFACIANDEAYYLRAEPLRHPLIFYYGHTATFFINKLILGRYIDTRINEDFESMFAVGVDEMSWDDLNTTHYDWPKVKEVAEYRKHVKILIEQLIGTIPPNTTITQDSLAWVILMGIEHERIHLETSSVILRMVPLNYLRQSNKWRVCSETGEAPFNELIAVAGESLTLGRGDENKIFGWDNEFGSKNILVNDFYASKFLVSNQEFLSFIESGGYENLEWWTSEGKKWLSYTNAKMPRFWRFENGQFWQRNLLEEVPLPLNWPVEVNYHEAKAFCNWKSLMENKYIRLPTEAEWTILRNQIEDDVTDWQVAPGNIDLEYYASSCPIDKFKNGSFYDVLGNVWQWTETAIDAFPGFKVHNLYDDFSTPTFDGQHNLIKGGSWISTGNLATKKARYAFRRHFFQHAGFRYVQSEHPLLPNEKINAYETDPLISQQLALHYGNEYFRIPNFPVACINQCKKFFNKIPTLKALDLGCSVGRFSFELAKYFEHVDGIDFSTRFIQQALRLKKERIIRYTITSEGDLVDYKELKLFDLGYHDLIDKINFIQGDACNLKPIFKDYNFIFFANLIEKLHNPALFLETISGRLKPKGILALTSTYAWLEEYTDKNNWLGGIKVNGESQKTIEGLKTILKPRFNLITTHDIPFVIRESERKFQHSIAQLSLWQLKE